MTIKELLEKERNVSRYQGSENVHWIYTGTGLVTEIVCQQPGRLGATKMILRDKK